MPALTLAQLSIAQQRLVHQHIATARHASAHEAVQWLGAIQAQDRASAAWSIGLRMPAATLATVEEAYAARTIVRTWLLRGTLHVVAATDLRWMLALVAPGALARATAFHRQLGLDATVVTQGYAAITHALQGGRQLTRKELLAEMANAGVGVEGMAASNLLNRAALDALTCLGTVRGKQDTFVLLDEWLPAATPLPRDEALARLALRYFTSHGPTTLRDFAWWAGLSMGDARAGLEAVKSHLAEQTEAGKTYWSAPLADVQSYMPIDAAQGAYLLPGFDEFVLGYGDRRDFLQAEHESLITGANAIFAYTMVWAGQVVGTWKRTLRKRAVEIAFAPFAPLSPAVMHQFATVAQRYGDFVNLPVMLSQL